MEHLIFERRPRVPPATPGFATSALKMTLTPKLPNASEYVLPSRYRAIRMGAQLPLEGRRALANHDYGRASVQRPPIRAFRSDNVGGHWVLPLLVIRTFSGLRPRPSVRFGGHATPVDSESRRRPIRRKLSPLRRRGAARALGLAFRVRVKSSVGLSSEPPGRDIVSKQ